MVSADSPQPFIKLLVESSVELANSYLYIDYLASVRASHWIVERVLRDGASQRRHFAT